MFRLMKHTKRDEGWTFIEATLAVVLVAIMVLGLTIVMLAFKEHLNRSWAVRVMDQYGNDVVEYMTHQLRNAVDLDVRSAGRNTHRIDIIHTDRYIENLRRTTRVRADIRNAQILVNDRPTIDPNFPPRRMARGESYEIVKFTLTPYGVDTPNSRERDDRFRRNDKFQNATYDLNLTLRYNKSALKPGQRNWSYQKEYHNRIYIRNMNLVVKKGIIM